MSGIDRKDNQSLNGSEYCWEYSFFFLYFFPQSRVTNPAPLSVLKANWNFLSLTMVITTYSRCRVRGDVQRQ